MPGFRLPEAALSRDIASLETLGVEIITNSHSACGKKAAELLESEGYEAVYIAGRSKPRAEADIKGSSLRGVFSADCFLNWVCSKDKDKYCADSPEIKGKKAVVLGSGAKALDAARSVRRFGAEVTIVSRTAENDMKVGLNEIKRAKEEDIGFIYQTSPIELLGRDGHVVGVWCEKLMALGDVKSGFKYIPLYESEFDISADLVITAADGGSEYFETAENGIFSFSGDVSAAEAMNAGKKAASVIDEYVKSRVRA
jgi:glutamate synthase (NADPH/NADH) small chain